MNRDRTWVGVIGMMAPLAILALAVSPGLQFPASGGPVRGKVTYEGRPVHGGYILFAPENQNSGDWAAAMIDEKGDYSIGEEWRRDETERFRICVLPSNTLGSKPRKQVVPERFEKLDTSGLQVRLGTEAAQVDVDLEK